MRFGKKLALQVTEDQSSAPYLSHKLLKEAINKIVRELRQYQSRVQSNDQAWRGSSLHAEGAASPQELHELEVRIAALDRELFDLVDEDLVHILAHVRVSEAFLVQRIGLLQSAAIEVGMLMEDAQLRKLEQSLPVKPESRQVLCQQILELRLRSAPLEAKAQLENLNNRYNHTVEIANKHSQYLEINVAGFRKLLKRHEKQIPQNFHARATPFFGFHRLVTHSSRQQLELVRHFGTALGDAWTRLAGISNSLGSQCVQPPLNELKNLGAECQMVLEIQKQLKGMHPGLAACPGMLYPKPGSEQHFTAQGQLSNQRPPWSAGPSGTEGGQATMAADLLLKATQADGQSNQQQELCRFLQSYSNGSPGAGSDDQPEVNGLLQYYQ